MSDFNPDNICCIIITFNPDQRLSTLINIIKLQVGKIIIVDNFSHQESFKILTTYAASGNIEIIKNDANLGIAKALNQGVDYASQLGFKWVITFDQDTEPSDDIINIISGVYLSCGNPNKIGAIGVNAVDVDDNIYYKVAPSAKFVTKDYLITSGCLMSTQIFSEVGRFREDFFIDNVDIEYSLRLRKCGKILLLSEKPGMLHKAGQSTSKSIGGIKIETSNHNSVRRYYMSRNHIILTKEYLSSFPFFILKLNFFYFLSLIKIIFLEKNKTIKIKSTLKGIYNGLFYKRNKCLMCTIV